MSYRQILAWIGLFVLIIASAGCSKYGNLQYRLVYVNYSLTTDANVPLIQDVMKRAKAAGFNGVLLAEYHLNQLDLVNEAYFSNLKKITATAKDLGLALYPEVCPFGSSWGLLANNPNLAEGIPVKNAVFLVKGRQAHYVPSVNLINGDFELTQNNKLVGWDILKYDLDKQTHHSGNQSVHIRGMNRLVQKITVSPFHLYHLSWWYKAENLEGSELNVRIVKMNRKTLASFSTTASAVGYDPPLINSEWTKQELNFNSEDNTKLVITLGQKVLTTKSAANNNAWWDDVKLDDVGMTNILRRDSCPLVVKGEDGTIYKEGQDFDPISDPRLGKSPARGTAAGSIMGIDDIPGTENNPVLGLYDLNHASPTIKLTANSKIKEGQKLLVSFYSTFPTSSHGEVSACLTDPEVYSLIEKTVKKCNSALQPDGFVMGHSEIHMINWCKACESKNMTPGQEISHSIKQCDDILKKVSPNTITFAWTDMFNPDQNAYEYERSYYQVNGSLLHSADGLSKDIIVLENKSSPQTIAFFEQHGNRQILAADCDRNKVGSIDVWLAITRDTGGSIKAARHIVGVCYVTRKNMYKDLEAFAKAAWGWKKWFYRSSY